MHTTTLLTSEDKANIPELYKSEDLKVDDMVVHAKFFTPWSNWTWYVIEFDGEDRCFGYVKGLEDEFGYFLLSELESIEGPFGLKVERDRHFEPKPFSRI